MLHNSHYGRNRMISLARTKIWFPGIDGAIEKRNLCSIRAESYRNTATPMGKTPEDYKWIQMVSDGGRKSKWPEVIKMGSTTAERTAIKLKESHSTHSHREGPAELLMGRRLRTVFDIVKAGVSTKESKYKMGMRKYCDQGKAERKYAVGQEVLLETIMVVTSIVTKVVGSRTYEVHYGWGQRKVHGQMKECSIPWECTEDYMLQRKSNVKGASPEGKTEETRVRRSNRKLNETERMREYREKKRKRVCNVIVDVVNNQDHSCRERDGIKAGEASIASIMWVMPVQNLSTTPPVPQLSPVSPVWAAPNSGQRSPIPPPMWMPG
ncbi:hypothetical protein OSTOST_14600 [Ostertagia ostertagi]